MPSWHDAFDPDDPVDAGRGRYTCGIHSGCSCRVIYPPEDNRSSSCCSLDRSCTRDSGDRGAQRSKLAIPAVASSPSTGCERRCGTCDDLSLGRSRALREANTCPYALRSPTSGARRYRILFPPMCSVGRSSQIQPAANRDSMVSSADPDCMTIAASTLAHVAKCSDTATSL